MEFLPLPAFQDNYIWVIFESSGGCVVIDPEQAEPVLAFLQEKSLTLKAILITHHHADHVGGIAQLLQHADVPVFGPAREIIPHLTRPLHEGDALHLTIPALDIQVMDVPGHTAGHIAYYCPHTEPPLLFAGDTLFNGGCGRLFEGTAAQMLASLDRLGALPDATQLWCAHEYTLANLYFARSLTPDDPSLAEYIQWATQQRARHLPTLPSTLATQKTINPFLNIDKPVLKHLLDKDGKATRAERFATLRQWKDVFRSAV